MSAKAHTVWLIGFVFPQHGHSSPCWLKRHPPTPLADILAPIYQVGVPIVEVFDDKEAVEPLFTAEFDFVPRIGEYLARDTPSGYFVHYNVVEVWHRQDNEAGAFPACIRVEIND